MVEVDEGELVPIGELSVRATPARHGDARRLFASRSKALGYLIAGSRRVYFAGDTDLFAGMADLAPVDVALLPVWGWGPRLPAGHLDPRRAAEALRLVRPRVAVPIHWGTLHRIGLRGSHRAMIRDAPKAFALAAAKRAPSVEVRILQPGEATVVSPAGG